MATPSLQEMIDNTTALMSSNVGHVLMLRENGTTDSQNSIVTAEQGPNGGMLIEYPAGAGAPGDAATETTLAAVLAKMLTAPSTELKQDDVITALGSILAKIIAAPATAALQTAANALLTTINTSLSRVSNDKAKSQLVHTCHDTTEVSTTGGIAFIVPTTGLHTFKLADDSSATESYLIAGVLYPGELLLMTTASVSATATVWYL